MANVLFTPHLVFHVQQPMHSVSEDLVSVLQAFTSLQPTSVLQVSSVTYCIMFVFFTVHKCYPNTDFNRNG